MIKTPALENAMGGPRDERAFMHRTVRYLAAERGITQFLDIGTGIPTSPNLHEVAQQVAPRHAWSTPTTTRSCWPTPGR